VEYAQLINSSGKHLLSLVNDLLDLSRIEAGKLELRCETVALDALIAECCETIAPRARQGKLTLHQDVDPSLPLLDADPRALKQILLNLLTNAVKFGNPGSTIGVVAVHEPSGGVMLEVRDTGIGIAPEDQAKVFERFGQASHGIAGIEKGTGLGLPIVKGLVEAHGGTIELESELGRGTTIRIRLPPERCVRGNAVALAS
jgi:signal transduction histidine kinase